MGIRIKDISKKFVYYRTSIYKTYIIITKPNQLAIEEFMKHNPPCKKCLVQSMCIEKKILSSNTIALLLVRSCDDLIFFIHNNMSFLSLYNKWTIINSKEENNV